jgi:hypothetical protein
LFVHNSFGANLPRGNLPDEETLEKLIKQKSYEQALRMLPKLKVEQSKNPYYIIVYDLLNVKIKKRNVKDVLCKEDNKNDPENYTYHGLLCDLILDYLDDGKITDKNLRNVEEYFLKHDQKKFYLFILGRDLNK